MTRALHPTERLALIKTPFFYPASCRIAEAKRLIVEIGPGRGDFLFHLAGSNPEATIVGIEIKRKRVDKLILRAEKRKLTNVIIIQDDARAAFKRFFAEESIDEIHIQFPDPWPKKRHAKHRAIGVMLLSDGAHLLKLGGSIAITTDSRPYALEIREHALQVRELRSLYDNDGGILIDPPDAFPTFFAQKWRAEGRHFFHQSYERKRSASLHFFHPMITAPAP